MKRSYPNPVSAQTENSLRQRVAELMVAVHLISPVLAEYHVATMTDSELIERLEIYWLLCIHGCAHA
jgi:hypothetical protein